MQLIKARSIVALSILILTCTTTQIASANGDLTMVGLKAWLDAYGDAWESRDADAAAQIFAEDATYQVTPYEEPHAGQEGVRQYWAGVTENQRNVQFDYQPIAVDGDTGIAHWSAQFDIDPDGHHLELDGIFVLKFDDDGKCRQLREWWHLKPQETGTE